MDAGTGAPDDKQKGYAVMGKMSSGLQTMLNTFYITTLKDADSIAEETPEKKNMYLSAFFGLMRNGHKYDVVEEKPKEIPKPEPDPKKKKKNSKKMEEFFEDDPTEKLEVTRTLVMLIDGKGYRCPEVDLQYAFGSMYDTVVNGTPKHRNYYLSEQNDDIALPDLYAETDADEKKSDLPAAQTAAAPVPAEKPKKQTIPYIGFNPKFENDEADMKAYDSFLFNVHRYKVKTGKDAEKTYTFNVYPLLPDTSDCMTTDILVIAQDEDGRLRPVMSDLKPGRQKSVKIEFDEISFIVRAHWEDERFISSIAVLSTKDGKQPITSDDLTPVVPTHRTSSFYLRHIADNGNALNVFPLTLLRNDVKTGLAPAIYMVEDGQSRKLFSSGDNTYVSMYFAGKELHVSSYWTGNYLQVDTEVQNV